VIVKNGRVEDEMKVRGMEEEKRRGKGPGEEVRSGGWLIYLTAVVDWLDWLDWVRSVCLLVRPF
jgi:hypothetical protein